MDVSGIPFSYDGVASSTFGLSLAYVDRSDYVYASGSGVTFSTEEIRKNPQLLFLGATQFPVLTFDIDIVSEEPMDVYRFNYVKDWIIGSSYSGFKKLHLMIGKLKQYYFNCKITPKEDLLFAGGYRGMTCTVECDSSWAWQFVTEKVYKSDGKVMFQEVFHNHSADANGLKPKIIFKLETGNSEFKIVNKTTGESFEWKDLSPSGDEIITCDCRTKLIESSLGLYRLKNFNKQFLTFKKGGNELDFIGKVQFVKIVYQNAVRLGGGIFA